MTRFTDKEKKTLVDITLQNMLPATREYIIEKRRKSDDDDDKEALLIVAEEVKVDDGKKYSILFRALADSIERPIEKMTELMSDEEIDFLAFYHERTHKVVFLGDSKKYHPETFEQWAYRLRNSGLVEARQKQGGKNKKKEYWMVIARYSYGGNPWSLFDFDFGIAFSIFNFFLDFSHDYSSSSYSILGASLLHCLGWCQDDGIIFLLGHLFLLFIYL
jgi:DNA-binding transcriptional ArsR family regulator